MLYISIFVLDLYNIITMKKKNRYYLMLTSVLVMFAIWGFIAIEKGTKLFNGIDIYIFALIVILGGIAIFNAFKRDKEEKLGLKTEDELSNLIKYKSGYHAFMVSMYMWLFIFVFKGIFPDTETMLGSGILLSGLIFFITRQVVKRKLYEE